MVPHRTAMPSHILLVILLIVIISVTIILPATECNTSSQTSDLLIILCDDISDDVVLPGWDLLRQIDILLD